MISLQGILLAALFLHMRANAETTISPREVRINRADYESWQCFTCTTTQQEIHWQMNGQPFRGSARPNGDQRVDTFCSNFTSDTTITCFGEPTTSISESDSAQVVFIDKGPVSTEPGSSGLPTVSETAGATITDSSSQPTSKPPDSTLPAAITVPVVLIVLCVVIPLLCYRHRKHTKMKQTANTQRETEGGRRPSTGVTCSRDAVTHDGENGMYNPEREPLSNEEKEEEKEEATLPSSADPTGKPSTSPNPSHLLLRGEFCFTIIGRADTKGSKSNVAQKLLSDEEKGEEEVIILAAAYPTPPVNDLHSSSKPEPFAHAQRAPLDLVKKDKEPSRIVETGRNSPNVNDGVPDGVILTAVELPDHLKTPPQVHCLPPDDIVMESLAENVVEQLTSSKPSYHVHYLPPEEKKREEATKLLDTDPSSIPDGYKSPDQSPFSVSCERSQLLGPQLIDVHGHQDSSSLQTGILSKESAEDPSFEESRSALEDPENSAFAAPQRLRRPTSFGLSLKRTLEGNDTVDKNSIQDGYKTPDQSPFSVVCDGSKVLGPQLIDAHGHQDSSSLQKGVSEDATHSSPEPTSPKPPLHVQTFATDGGEGQRTREGFSH